MGKHGASVPSTRMMREFCPARHCQDCSAPRMNFFISLKACRRVHHLVSTAVLINQPVEHCVDLRPVLLPDKRGVLFQVVEIVVLEHGRFVDVIIRGNSIVVGDFRQSLHIIQVVPADVDVEEHRGAVAVLPANQIVKIPANRS